MFNDIPEMLGIKVKNLKITQNLGLHLHKNVKALFCVGQLTYYPSACLCCAIKNETYLSIKHVDLCQEYEKKKRILPRFACLFLFKFNGLIYFNVEGTLLEL